MTAIVVAMNQTLRGDLLKKVFSMIAVQIGVEPMATTVPTATPVFRTDEKKSS